MRAEMGGSGDDGGGGGNSSIGDGIGGRGANKEDEKNEEIQEPCTRTHARTMNGRIIDILFFIFGEIARSISVSRLR